ncbi:MAG: adenylate kinase family protein [Candidatus Micrarchaeia archaeon]
MRVLVTGVPGTGKSSLAPYIARRLGAKLIAINALVRQKKLYSRIERDGTLVVRVESLKRELARLLRQEKNAVVEGHLGCEMRLPVDLVIVTRTNPRVLARRLRARGYAKRKIEENVLAEALDYATINATQRFGKVYEIDTTGRRADRAIADILAGKGERYKAGWVSWSDELARLAAKGF